MSLGESINQINGALFEMPIALMQKLGNDMGDILSTTNGGVVAQIANGLQSATSKFIPSLMSLGYALCIVFWIVALIELTTSERLTFELFIKSVAKFGVGVGLVSVSDQMFLKLMAFGESFAKDVSAVGYAIGSTPGDINVGDQIAEAFNKYNEFMALAWLPLFLFSLVVCLLCLTLVGILYMVTYLIAITRLIELNIRGCMLPIAFALLADDGWRGAGGRYIKKFLAVVSQGVVLTLIGKITSGAIGIASQTMSSQMLSNFNGTALTDMAGDIGTLTIGLVSILAVGFASVSTMFKSQQLMNDVFGA